MKIRHSMELLLNLGNYSNIKLIAEIEDEGTEADIPNGTRITDRAEERVRSVDKRGSVFRP